jgi:hypothetical protein
MESYGSSFKTVWGIIRKLKLSLYSVKWILYIFLMVSLTKLSGQNSSSLANTNWRLDQGWIGSDTLVLIKDMFPDTSDSVNLENAKAMMNYLKHPRILFDEDGNFKSYHFYMECPVGEIIPKMVNFTINKREVTINMEYHGEGNNKVDSNTFLYIISVYSNTQFILIKKIE